MSQDFIDQVLALIMSNISDEKFGVQDLASQLELSPSQTLRKVKAATGKSVNQYIRELRLEKAAKLIKKTDLSIAEISYQVGFGSPSYFNKAFVNYYGIAPGEYKTKRISLSFLAVKAIKNKHRETSLKIKILYPFIIVLVFIIGYLLINNSTSKNASFSNSIAVLPFKDYSPEKSQWFSDGVSDNILHSLSQMKGLSVVSFTSSSTYRDTDKQIPEIAKELGVSYILEGSVTLYDDQIKIIAQLIDSNDEHIWSKEYHESFYDIITVQNNLAQEVVKQLKITLGPNEIKIFKKFPTKNMEAYSLYLKGRSFNKDTYLLENQKRKIEFYQKAIALDSNFVEPYSELAYIYYVMADDYNTTINPFDSREKALYYLNKALQKDPNASDAWFVKGYLNLFVNWDSSKEYLNKAIELNPNNGQAHNALAIYYEYRPNKDLKKTLHHFKIA